jgi:hypothetical protein
MRIARNGHTLSDSVASVKVINQRFAGETTQIGLVRCEIKTDLTVIEGDVLEIFLNKEEIISLYDEYVRKLSIVEPTEANILNQE